MAGSEELVRQDYHKKCNETFDAMKGSFYPISLGTVPEEDVAMVMKAVHRKLLGAKTSFLRVATYLDQSNERPVIWIELRPDPSFYAYNPSLDKTLEALVRFDPSVFELEARSFVSGLYTVEPLREEIRELRKQIASLTRQLENEDDERPRYRR